MARAPLLAVGCAAGLALGAAAPLLAAGSRSQDREVAWLRDNAVALRSIDPGATDYSDLAPLRSVLAGKRIVILGEANHRDGTTLQAKSRLVQFLHRELGFDVLAFESGFYDCWKAWQRIQAGDDAETAFRQSVFAIWTQSAQVQPLIAYFAAAAHAPRPLQLAGIDPQFTGEMSARFLLNDLAQLAKPQGPPNDKTDDLAARIAVPLANLVEGRYERGELPPEAARAELFKGLDELDRRLRAAGREVAERDFWLRVTYNIRQLAAPSWAIDWKRPITEDPAKYAVRDRVMGENLAWLARHRFAGRKIVVWAASGHAARDVDTIDVSSPVSKRLYRTLQPMGAAARRELGKELYTVAVVTYQGRYGTPAKPIDILKPSAGSLEDLFHRTGLPYAFLDLSRPSRLPGWLGQPLIARPMGYTEMKARWGRVFDGVLFLDRMGISERSAQPSPQP